MQQMRLDMFQARDLLFGILAVQLRFVSLEKLA